MGKKDFFFKDQCHEKTKEKKETKKHSEKKTEEPNQDPGPCQMMGMGKQVASGIPAGILMGPGDC